MSSTADRLTMLRSYPTMASSDDYTDAYLSLALTMAEADIQAYCHRTDTGGDSWDSIVIRYAVIQVNRLGAEGATKAKEGGSIDRDWAEGALPSEIRSLLKPYRLVTGLGDGTGSGGSTGTIDPELDPDSENPVMNKAICAGIATEVSDRQSAVAALEVRVGDLEAAQATIDTHLDPTSENAVQNQAIALAVQSVEDSLDEAQRTLQAGINANATAIQGNAQAITAEETARIAADADLQNQIDNIEVTVTIDDAMSTTSENAVQNKVITAAIQGEASARETADNALQAQIDAISSSSDVVDIVGTYAELTSYDTSTLTEGDIVMVLSDSTRQDATTYYRWLTAGGGMWSYVGSEAPSYTKAETDAIVENAVAGKQDALTFDTAPTPGSSNPVTSGGIATAISAEASARTSADTNLSDAITAEASARADADTTLTGRIADEEAARASADADLQNQIDAIVVTVTVDPALDPTSTNPVENSAIASAISAEETARSAADTALRTDLSAEVSARTAGDLNLQRQIDAMELRADVVDIIGSYWDLEHYDTSALTEDDVIKILHNETHEDATTYHRWVPQPGGGFDWSYIGLEGPYYTKAEVDELIEQGGGGGGSVTVDSAMSITSHNPVQNRVITTTINSTEASLRGAINQLSIDLENKLDAPIHAGTRDQYVRMGASGPEWRDADIDADLDDASEFPVQNKVVTEAVNDLQEQIDTLVLASDVVDIVGTYEDLMEYDTSEVNPNDIIKVLADETHDDTTAYWRWTVEEVTVPPENEGDEPTTETVEEWTFVGSESAKYTKAEIDALLRLKQDKLTAGSGITLGANGKTPGHINSVTAETAGKGSATAIPKIKYDSEGHITSVTEVTVYPPTTVGTLGQYWKSDGAGAGVWTDPETTVDDTSTDAEIASAKAVYDAMETRIPKPDEDGEEGQVLTLDSHLEPVWGKGTVDVDDELSDTSENPVQNKVIKTTLDAKQDTLTAGTGIKITSGTIAINADTTPTAGSTKPVTSGGIKTALDGKQASLTFDTTPTSGSTNPVTSDGIADAIASAKGTWEELDPANLPTDFQDGDILMMKPKILEGGAEGTSTGIVTADLEKNSNWCGVIYKYLTGATTKICMLDGLFGVANWNNGQPTDKLIKIVVAVVSSTNRPVNREVTRAEFADCVARIWRMRR